MDQDLDRRLLIGAAGLAGVAALSRLAHAGPLTPPGGAVASTGKTLSDVEPRIAVNATNTPGDAASMFVLSQPGSYYLTGNIIATGNLNGVSITNNGVRLDLNGFTIFGAASATASGVVLGGADIHVHGGAITTFARGVLSNGGYPIVERLSILSCSVAAIDASLGALVVGCHVDNGNVAGAAGVVVGFGSAIMDCTVTNCNGTAFSVGSGVLVQRCAASSCGTGVGPTSASGVAVINCAFNGLANGVVLGNGALVRACTLRSCGTSSATSYGVSVGNGSTIEGCSFHDIVTGANTANTASAAINATGDANISGCTIASNAGGSTIRGIITNGGMVSGCSVSVLGRNSIGITVGGGSIVIRGNRVVAGGASSVGISSGTGNTICDNHISAATGIDLSGNAGNHVVRNFIHGAGTPINTSLPANNIIGPSLAPAGVAASSNPHANYVL
jgi:hypothetical protein